jgi:hypothetical protein
MYLTNIEQHDSDDCEIKNERSWSLQKLSAHPDAASRSRQTYTSRQGITRPDEQTSSDTASNSDHVQMTHLQRLVELVVDISRSSSSERVPCQSHSRQNWRPFSRI